MNTQLIYLIDMTLLNMQAQIIDVKTDNDSTTIVLDRTIFYPQGGGQPSDEGIIENSNGVFEVKKVYKADTVVIHEGLMKSGHFSAEETVMLSVNKSIRDLHNRNHTAGHLVDYALAQLGYQLESLKGYHFPQGPYVEYKGVLSENERAQLLEDLEDAINALVQRALPVTISFLNDDPSKRVMNVNSYEPILCGGTHVQNTKDIGHITIRKIKNEKGNVRISYSVDY